MPAGGSDVPKGRVWTWWTAVREPLIAHLHPRFYLMPDDCLFVGMLAAWVSFVAIVTHVLLGWVCAVALVIAMGLFGIAAMKIDGMGDVASHAELPPEGWRPFQAPQPPHNRVGVPDPPIDSAQPA